jgi:hypothetical protein
MPPEQGQGFSDIVDDRLGFGAHVFLEQDGWNSRQAGIPPTGQLYRI